MGPRECDCSKGRVAITVFQARELSRLGWGVVRAGRVVRVNESSVLTGLCG